MALVIYTSEEVAKKDRLMMKHRKEMDQAQWEYAQAVREEMFSKDAEQFSKISENLYQLGAKHSQELDAIEKVAIQRYFSYNAENFHQIISDLKEDISLSIQRLKTTREVLYSPRESWSFNMGQIEEIRNALVFNKNALKENPGDEELAKATEEMEETLHELLTDSQYTNEWIDRTIVMNYSFYLDFVKDHDPKSLEDMLLFIKMEAGSADLDSPFEKLFMFPEFETTFVYPTDFTTLLPQLTTSFPDVLVFPKDKVSQRLFDPTDKQIELNKLNPIGIKQVDVMVSLRFDELDNITISRKLTPYDYAVYKAITSWLDKGVNTVTPQMIYQVISCDKQARLTQKSPQYNMIQESIYRLRHTEAEIDATQEANLYTESNQQVDMWKMKDFLINAAVITAKINGQLVENALHFEKVPLTHRYASLKKQISRIEMKYLNVPLENTEENILIKYYLSDRVSAMKKGGQKRILYDRIFEHLNMPTEPGALKKKKSLIRKKVTTILDYWISVKWIKGYDLKKESRTFHAIDIRP